MQHTRPERLGGGFVMAARATRGRWFAVLVPVLLLGLLAGPGGSSSAVGTDRLELRLGVTGVVDGFHWDGDVDEAGTVQALEQSSCVVSSPAGSPQLVALSATKASDPLGALIGRNGDALGVKGTSENVGSSGEPCGEIDHQETLTVALGAALPGKRAVSGQLVLVPRPGPRVDPTVELLDAAGALVRVVEVAPIGGPTTVTIPAGAPFHQVRLGSDTPQDNRAFGLVSGSYLQLEDEWSSTLPCEVGDAPISVPPPAGDIGVDIEILTSVPKDGSSGPCVLRYDLETTSSPTLGRRVLFEFPELDWELTFRWTTTWTEEPQQYPIPPTRISVDGGATFEDMVLCDGTATLPAGVDWCLEQQTVTARPDGTMQVTDVSYGEGDPINLR